MFRPRQRGRPRPDETPNELWLRFFSKVTEKRNGCLVWNRGEPRISFKGKPQLAHRFHYFIVHDEWPSADLRKLCKTQGCVNCAHYALSTDPKIREPRIARLRNKIAALKLEIVRLSSKTG